MFMATEMQTCVSRLMMPAVLRFNLPAGCRVEVKQRSVRRPELVCDSKSLSLHVPRCLCKQRTVKVCLDCILSVSEQMITQLHITTYVDNMQQNICASIEKTGGCS